MNLGFSEQELREAQAKLKKLRPPLHDLEKISRAAELCGLHSQTIRKWVREGRIKAWGFRGSRQVRLSDLLPEIEITQPTTPDGNG